MDSIAKRKREEKDKLQIAEEKLGKFEKTRKVIGSSALDIEEMDINKPGK